MALLTFAATALPNCPVVSATIGLNRGTAPTRAHVLGNVIMHAGHSGASSRIGFWQYGQGVTWRR